MWEGLFAHGDAMKVNTTIINSLLNPHPINTHPLPYPHQTLPYPASNPLPSHSQPCDVTVILQVMLLSQPGHIAVVPRRLLKVPLHHPITNHPRSTPTPPSPSTHSLPLPHPPPSLSH